MAERNPEKLSLIDKLIKVCLENKLVVFLFLIGLLAWGVMAVFLIFATISTGMNYMAWATVGLGAVFAVLFALDGFKN